MEHMQWDVPIGHALDKGGDGFFVIAGGKTGGQPKAEAPGRGQGRPPGERGVTPENLLGRRPIDQAVGEPLAFHRKLNPLHLFTGHLKGHVAGIVDKDAISPVGHIKGDILVGLLAGRAAVRVPHIHALAVFHVAGKALAQAIHAFAHIQHERIGYIVLSGLLVQAGGHAAKAAGGQNMAIGPVIHLPPGGLFGNFGTQRAAEKAQCLIVFFDNRGDGRCIELKVRTLVLLAGEVGDIYPDNPFHGRAKAHGQRLTAQSCPAVLNGMAGRQHAQRAVQPA